MMWRLFLLIYPLIENFPFTEYFYLYIEGEKPYVCDFPQCQKKFSQSSNLKKHKLVHSGMYWVVLCSMQVFVCITVSNCYSGEKPFRCHYSGCGKLFDQSCNLNKHFLTHMGSKPYTCSWPLCGEKFSQSSNLTKHLRKHMGDGNSGSLIKCDFPKCAAILTDTNSLIQHKLIHSINNINNIESDASSSECSVRKEQETDKKSSKKDEANTHNTLNIHNHTVCQPRFSFDSLPLSLNMSLWICSIRRKYNSITIKFYERLSKTIKVYLFYLMIFITGDCLNI